MAAATETSQPPPRAVLDKYATESIKRLHARHAQSSASSTKKRTHVLGVDDTLSPFAHLALDPWVDHASLNAQSPPALVDDQRTDFLVIGSGHGGLTFAAHLIDHAGIAPARIRLLDSAGGFGGTWYWNRYPGLTCDVESSVYMPLLEETGYVPQNRYAFGPELRAHAERIAERWGLADKALFRSAAESLVWDDEAMEWVVRIAEYRGPAEEGRWLTVRARFVMLAGGFLVHPQIPRAPGFERFGAKHFHTARWDYDYTGGSTEDPRLEGLRGKRVGIIGTGSTGIQVVPQLARWAEELLVFQRTPAAVDRRDQQSIDLEAWQREVAIGPGWQAERMANYAAWTTGVAHVEEDNEKGKRPNLVNDGWTRAPAFSIQLGSSAWGAVVAPDQADAHAAVMHALDAPRMQRIRQRVADTVTDARTAEQLTPWFPSWCKRLTFHDEYLPTFNMPHVRLIDTDGKGIEGYTETAVIVDGIEYPVDVLVLATGYRTPFAGGGSPARRANARVVGRGGRTMDDKWDESGASTLHGFCSNGFPNLFFPGLAQAGLSSSITHTHDTQARHFAYVMKEAARKAEAEGSADRFTVEPTKQAEEAWSMRVAEAAAFFSPISSCGPGLVNDDGATSHAPRTLEEALKAARAVPWPKGMLSYLQELEAWREKGGLEGIKVRI